MIAELRAAAPQFKVFVQRLQNDLYNKKTQRTQLQELICEVGAHLPPCRVAVSRGDELIEQFKNELKQVRTVQGGEKRGACLRALIQQYKRRLLDTGMNVSQAFALIQRTARESFTVQLSDTDDNVSKLLQFGNNILRTTSRQAMAEKCIKLFGQTLMRERRNHYGNEVTETMEDALYGILQCAIILDRAEVIQRTVLRVADLAAIGQLCHINLSMLTAGLLCEVGEPDAALSLLLSNKNALQFDEGKFDKDVLMLNTMICQVF